MITSAGDDIIDRAPAIGDYQLIVVCCDLCFC